MLKSLETLKKGFLLDVKNIVNFEQILSNLTTNCVLTMFLLGLGQYMEKEETWTDQLAGKNNKRQSTTVFGGSMVGKFLPIQFIYQRKTQQCLPIVKFQANRDVTFSQNNWSNEGTMTDYFEISFDSIYQKKRDKNCISYKQVPCISNV